MGLTPPTMLRNCDGGLTWKGRTARTSWSDKGWVVRLRTVYRATSRESPRDPDANADTRSSHGFRRHVTAGIGRAASSRDWRVSTSAQPATRESATTGRLRENPP